MRLFWSHYLISPPVVAHRGFLEPGDGSDEVPMRHRHPFKVALSRGPNMSESGENFANSVNVRMHRLDTHTSATYSSDVQKVR